MSRNGSGVYTLPAGSTVTNGDTSDATDVNTPLADLETDANTARPVVAGGTGETSVSAVQTAFKIPAYDGTPTISGAWTVSGAWTYTTANQKYNDTIKALYGTGADMEVYHDGVNSRITDNSAGFIMKCNNFLLRNLAGTEDMIEATPDGAVKLRHNGTARVTTTASGVDIAGDLEADTFSGAGVSTDISADTGSTTKLPHVAAVEAAIAAADISLTLKTIQASTSGTTIDFTSIPAGTKEIEIMFNGVSLSGTDNVLVQLGDAGGFETTGYVSGSVTNVLVSSTSGMIMQVAGATRAIHGKMSLTLMDAATFTWSAAHSAHLVGTFSIAGGGSKALSAELTQVRITVTGSDTFDAGSINVAYR